VSEPERQGQPHPIGASSALFALIVSVLWGGNIVSLKIGLTAIPPFWCAFWRMLFGAIVVTIWAAGRGVSLWPPPEERKGLLGLGLLFTAQIALMNAGAMMTSPAFGEVIINSYAVFANVVAHFTTSHERLNGFRAAGLALAFSGLCVVALARPDAALAPRPLEGNLVMVASSFLLGVRQVYTRWLVQTAAPARAVVWMIGISVPLFALGALISREPLLTRPLMPAPVLAVLYQGVVVAGVCFVGWAWLLKRHAAGQISMFSFVVPFAGMTFSATLLGEPLRAGLLTGAALALGGLLMVTVGERVYSSSSFNTTDRKIPQTSNK
jgi:O-acetylserine/cysteine efflux transporter